MRLTKKQEKELFFYMQRELKKLKEVFKEVELKNEKASEIFCLAKTYFEDALYFKEKKEYVKVFELVNYCWGLLDALAISKALKIPTKMKKWFKIEQ
ncbi:MAG: DUF357 domain-containing protein [Candidatus Pacearchaeota archaeon]